MIGERGRDGGQQAAFLSADVGGGALKELRRREGREGTPMYFVSLVMAPPI